jgi:hypothetical protein
MIDFQSRMMRVKAIADNGSSQESSPDQLAAFPWNTFPAIITGFTALIAAKRHLVAR